jgi:putative aminopeptidase FrvX
LIAHAKKHNITYEIDIFPFYGSDGSALLRAGNDVKVALVGQGVDASHGYERTHSDALVATAKLATLFIS